MQVFASRAASTAIAPCRRHRIFRLLIGITVLRPRPHSGKERHDQATDHIQRQESDDRAEDETAIQQSKPSAQGLVAPPTKTTKFDFTGQRYS
jgi:hypothetical protein